MTKRHDDPIRATFRRVLMLSMIVTVILIGVTYLLAWSTIHVLIGFFIGVAVNLLNFWLMVMSAKKLLDKSKNGIGVHGLGFLGRLGLYALCLILMAQLSLAAFLGTAVGLSMVGLALKLNGLFLKDADKEK